MSAHKINEPILLIHGEADNNTGTFPIQSDRMYQALRGTGAPSAMSSCRSNHTAILARESTEHAPHEMISFDRHVKDAPPRAAKDERDGK